MIDHYTTGVHAGTVGFEPTISTFAEWRGKSGLPHVPSAPTRSCTRSSSLEGWHASSYILDAHEIARSCTGVHWFQTSADITSTSRSQIVPDRFELSFPPSGGRVIDHYTTGLYSAGMTRTCKGVTTTPDYGSGGLFQLPHRAIIRYVSEHL